MIELLLSALLVLVPGFEDEFADVTDKTGLNFILVEHEDLSVTLYAWDNKTTTLGADGLPDRMTPMASFTNKEALPGANGVKDVLDKVPTWNLSTLRK
jgi:hypothetical protein